MIFMTGRKELQRKICWYKKTDILIPGARPDSINEHNVNAIQASCIVPIANIAATKKIEHMLSTKGIVYVPGFVSNSGGILSFFLGEQYFNNKEIEDIIRGGFSLKIRSLIKQAVNSNTPVSREAREHARNHMDAMLHDRRSPILKKMNARRLLWLVYRAFAKIHCGFFLKPYARKYIVKKLIN